MITYNDFDKVDLRVGRITHAEEFPKARKAAYKITVDFGVDIGVKKSSAQITENYSTAELIGKLVIAVVNFPPKQIADMKSEVLILGVPDSDGNVVLLTPERDAEPGCRVY